MSGTASSFRGVVQKVLGVEPDARPRHWILRLACGHQKHVVFPTAPKHRKFRCFRCRHEPKRKERQVAPRSKQVKQATGIDWNALPFAKGESTRELRDRAQKRAKAVERKVRRIVMDRDRVCVVPHDPRWPCDGRDEWAHLEEGKRAKTGGRDPEARHLTQLSARMCRQHHDMYDGRARPRLTVRFLTDARADGPMEFRVDDQVVGEGRD